MSQPEKYDLVVLGSGEGGKFIAWSLGSHRPVIAETIPLARTREAFERGVAGHTRGKLVLQVAAPERASA